jgi:hypothetical protein
MHTIFCQKHLDPIDEQANLFPLMPMNFRSFHQLKHFASRENTALQIGQICARLFQVHCINLLLKRLEHYCSGKIINDKRYNKLVSSSSFTLTQKKCHIIFFQVVFGFLLASLIIGIFAAFLPLHFGHPQRGKTFAMLVL